MKNFETLSEAMQDLKQRGYAYDFTLNADAIECQPINQQFTPSNFHVDEVHRFEGKNDPDDSSILFAITSSTGVKGLIVDAYGAYADSLNEEMIKRLTIDIKTKH